MEMPFHQYTEYDPLRKVVIGRYREYARDAAYIERINEDQKKGLPGMDQLHGEFEGLRHILEHHEIEVLEPDYVGPFVYDQLTPRDLGVVIGNRFLLCPMAFGSRRYEAAGIFRFLEHPPVKEPLVLIPDSPDILIEGGDILVDGERIYVGLSSRTNRAGVEWMKRTFGDAFEVIEVPLKSSDEGEHVLHLDCAFNILDNNHALIYPAGLKHIPGAILRGYELTEVNREEQQALVTNFLPLSPDIILSRDHPHCKRVALSLRGQGKQVLEIPFDAAPATGGSLRCCTLPLFRGD
jgi:N-dimethylarginine dimethylaminohydrolase